MVIELKIATEKLILSIDESFWCKISLIKDKNSYDLGAEKYQFFIEKMYEGLKATLERDIREKADNKDISGIISLADGHTTIYCSSQKDTQALLFYDDNGKLISQIVFDKKDMNNLVRQLSKLLEAKTPINPNQQ